MAFDGSIEWLTCITQHDNYVAMTNRMVLQVASFFKHDFIFIPWPFRLLKNGAYFESLKLCQCLRTNWTHIAQTARSEGNRYICIPGLNVVFFCNFAGLGHQQHNIGLAVSSSPFYPRLLEQFWHQSDFRGCCHMVF